MAERMIHGDSLRESVREKVMQQEVKEESESVHKYIFVVLIWLNDLCIPYSASSPVSFSIRLV